MKTLIVLLKMITALCCILFIGCFISWDKYWFMKIGHWHWLERILLLITTVLILIFVGIETEEKEEKEITKNGSNADKKKYVTHISDSHSKTGR